jgi:phosphoribosylanthranilate isomerase
MVFPFHAGLPSLAWHSPVRVRSKSLKIMRTWIKICGTTCVEDALKSVEAGADALGFIFARSQRQVTPEQARSIIGELPRKMERIGVFMDQPAEEVARIVTEVDLSGFQLHGAESPAEVCALLPEDLWKSMWKIKTVLVKGDFAARFQEYAPVDVWLLDSGAGSGETFDWHAARAQWKDRQELLMVAGGLTPANVGEAIRTMKPWGVDVVSGVEREPGRKDPEKLRAFVAAVRRAEEA